MADKDSNAKADRAGDQALKSGGLIGRLRRWAFGNPGHPGVLNQTAPATFAGDAPGLTSHGAGPSRAHDPKDDVPAK